MPLTDTHVEFEVTMLHGVVYPALLTIDTSLASLARLRERSPAAPGASPLEGPRWRSRVASVRASCSRINPRRRGLPRREAPPSCPAPHAHRSSTMTS